LFQEIKMIATAKLFQNGKSQAVRLPREFRFEGDKVYIRKMGKAVVLLPYDDPWCLFFDALEMFPEDFMADGRQQPTEQQVRPELDNLYEMDAGLEHLRLPDQESPCSSTEQVSTAPVR
jgi:antitoxin VapB